MTGRRVDLPGNMSDYVLVKPELDPNDDEKKQETLELPTEDDGTLLLSVLKSQFERATGLKYRFYTTASNLSSFIA